jgi:FMN phosphatase YigB (HAD superfamily)
MPCKQQVRAVVLDAGGVILLPDLGWLASEATRYGLSLSLDRLVAAYYRAIFQLDQRAELARRGPSFKSVAARQWFIGHMLRFLEVPADLAEPAARAIAERAAEEFPRESDIWHFALPGTRQRLERLAGAGFLLGCASNNDGALEAQLTDVGVVDLLVTHKDSGIEGVSKPEPELLLRAARDLGVDPGECLYVGDVDRVDGVAARAAGMCFALLDPLRQPRPTSPLLLTDLDEVHRHFAPPP